MRLFLDTSALAKRYVAEAGTEKVQTLCARASRLGVSVICLPEMISTLSRLVRDRSLGSADYQALKMALLADLADADLCEITTAVMAEVIALLETHALRAMDAIHVACAVAYRADVFASADRRQIAAARKLKLKVVDVS